MPSKSWRGSAAGKTNSNRPSLFDMLRASRVFLEARSMFAVVNVRAAVVTAGFGLALGLTSCSKGGAPDQNNMCQKLTDQVTDTRPALPNALYAELKGSSSETPLGLMLDG